MSALQGGLRFVGREAETATIVKTLDEGMTFSSALLIVGEPGSGKTALLEFAHERARPRGARILKARGCTSLRDRPFAALQQLVESASPAMMAPPETVKAVLHPPIELALVAETLISWFSRLAAEAPLVLSIDDAHLLDTDSGKAVNVILRHFTSDRIAILLSSESARPAQLTVELPTVVIPQLEDRFAAQLLDSITEGLSGRTRLEILRQAGGNPLALIELARSAATESITTMMTQRDTNRGSRLKETFADHLAQLPEITRKLLLYAAATQYGELSMATAAAGEGSDLAGWAPAELAGFISITGDRVVFQHPLVRNEVYESAPAAVRAQAHHDLAQLPELDPVDRARHLARSYPGPDETIARALEEAAEYARDRGEAWNATRLLERAAENTLDRDTRARRYAEAIRNAADFGDPQWVRQLHTTVVSLTDDPDIRGSSAVAAGHALALSSLQREAFQLLNATLLQHRPRDWTTVLSLASVLGSVAAQSGLPEHRAALPRMLEIVAESPRTGRSGLVSAGAQAALLESVLVIAAPLTHATKVLHDPDSAVHQPLGAEDEPLRLVSLGAVAWFAGDYHVSADVLQQALALVGSRPSHGLIALCIPVLASSLIITGRWAEADTLLNRARNCAVVHRLRHIAADVEALHAELRTLRGAPDVTALDSVWSTLDLTENRSTEARLRRTAGLTALAVGDPEAAFAHLTALFGQDGSPRDLVVSNRSLAELAAAAVLVGREAEVTPIIEAACDGWSGAQLQLVLHHATALISEKTMATTAVEAEYRAAIEHPDAGKWPYDHAMAQLSYAMWLRRQRRAIEARPPLKAVLQTSLELGATKLTEFARNELRASGAAVTDDNDLSRLDTLTSQQREAVLLAASGLRNREIAERLFLSPRTVSTHLSNAYQKLGISGRHQLSRLVESSDRRGA